MGIGDRKRELFEDIVRLRRAEREAPASRDIVAVRARLEDELGKTVSRRFAASLLGVSHTALEPWIKAGDIPLVHDANGRQGIALPVLLDLFDAVSRERRSGRRRRHVLEPTMSERRERARRIRREDLISPQDGNGHDAHDRATRRALAYHRAVAHGLRRSTVDDALHLVWQWRDQGQLDERYAQQWEEVLRRPVREVQRIIGEDTPFARDLRQNSPFAGALSEAERRKILQEVR